MSLHAQISPEAQAALAAQKRNSTIAAIIIALLTCALVGLIFWFFKLYLPDNSTKPIVAYAGDPEAEEKLVKPKVTSSVKKKPSPPSSASTPVIASTAPSPIAVPNQDVPFDAPVPDFGNSSGFETGFGSSDGEGFGADAGFSALPASMQTRCAPAERLARVKEMGGTEACDDAVVKSLQWMQKTQNEDGSWCKQRQVAMTGLSILAYLGHCETPLSPDFGETVEKGIVFLVNHSEKDKGKLGGDFSDKHWTYEHAIATYALAEAYTFCNLINYKVPGLRDAVEKAAKILIKGQSDSGSWKYSFANQGGHMDTSLSGFCLQALKACKHTGISLPTLKSSGKKGIKYIINSQNPSGMIGYDGKKRPKLTMTGAGLLCLQQWGKGNSKTARRALKALNEQVKFEYPQANFYGQYYYGQTFMEAGGDSWTNYNAMFRDQLLSGQNPDGTFKRAQKLLTGRGAKFATHYRTCLATLSLEVYYRFLPGTSKGK